MSKALPRKFCNNHCATCNEHFSGLRAFDAHLRDDGQHTVCMNPADAVFESGKRKGEPMLESAWERTDDNGWVCEVVDLTVHPRHTVATWQRHGDPYGRDYFDMYPVPHFVCDAHRQEPQPPSYSEWLAAQT